MKKERKNYELKVYILFFSHNIVYKLLDFTKVIPIISVKATI